MKTWDDTLLTFDIKEDSVVFHCSGMEEGREASVMEDFLQDFSKDRQVFLHTFKLDEKDTPALIDPRLILQKARMLDDPDQRFFHLREAELRVAHADCVCEAEAYFFENHLRWDDFLASAPIRKREALIKAGKLSGYFITADCGADYYFGCAKKYEPQVRRLWEQLAAAGCRIQRSRRVKHL